MPRRCLYLGITKSGLHKIGFSCQPEVRAEGLIYECGEPVSLLHHVWTPHATWLEAHLKLKYQPKQVIGELFTLSDDEVHYICSLDEDTVEELHTRFGKYKTTKIQVEADLAQMLGIIAASKGRRVSIVLSSLIREEVERMYNEIMQRVFV
jgi:hypothetical protein